jgi:hypothetical protein
MSFTNNNLQPVGGHTGEGPGLYIYHTEDAKTDVETDGYLDEAANRLEQNAVIFAITGVGGTESTAIYRVDKSGTDITLNVQAFN